MCFSRSKIYGLTVALAEVISTLHIENWPAPLLTDDALFGISTTCSGLQRCDQVQQRAGSGSERDLFDRYLWPLTGRLLQYIVAGAVSELEGDEIAENLRITMAVCIHMDWWTVWLGHSLMLAIISGR